MKTCCYSFVRQELLTLLPCSMDPLLVRPIFIWSTTLSPVPDSPFYLAHYFYYFRTRTCPVPTFKDVLAKFTRVWQAVPKRIRFLSSRTHTILSRPLKRDISDTWVVVYKACLVAILVVRGPDSGPCGPVWLSNKWQRSKAPSTYNPSSFELLRVFRGSPPQQHTRSLSSPI